ncbi:hypothetical protein OC846_001194 [Tilletia horrida]|uniref:Coenzyme Q-binding protein COQ10 START domain-containing protein n=1 Tax=Tilletia horrida TaxID=155126 RepID=A0AAN6GZB9_9BASI|nr:hypothetical protein OC846_001194 [Tilletia horrida]KAK0569271.1 hypothetical protein OC861_001086 [Tilletia horrida]
MMAYRTFTRPKTSTEELYNIVADVDSYDLFLPNCLQSRVLGPATPAYPINIPKSRRSEFSPTSTPGRREGKAVRAELTVGFKAFRESYTSRVEMVSPRYVNATADTASNPLFKHLYTEWSFHPISAQYSGSTVPLSLFGQTASSSTSRPSPSAPPSSSTTRPTQSLTRLDFHLEYAFRNPIYGLVASQAFDVMARKMMNAFEERAIQLYGRR